MARKRKHHRSRSRRVSGTITIPAIAAIIGTPCLILFLIPTVISLVQKEWVAAIAFFAFVLLALLLVLTLNWRIDYDPQGFTYRDLLRISHRYRWNDIRHIFESKDSIVIVRHRIILLDAMSDGVSDFLRTARMHLPPEKPRDPHRYQVFGGKVHNPWEFIILFGGITLLFAGLLIYILIDYRPLRMENLETAEVTLVDVQESFSESDTPQLLLMENKSEYFLLYDYETAGVDADALRADVQAGRTFRIGYQNAVFEDFTRRDVYTLDCGSTCYLSLTQSNSDRLLARRICIGALVFWFLFLAVGDFAIRHADKYPRLARLFVKDDYLR